MKYRSRELIATASAWLGSLSLVGAIGIASAGPNDIAKVGSVVAQVEALNCAANSFQALGLQLRASDEYVLTTLCEAPWDDSLRYAAIAVAKDRKGKLLATNVSSLGVSYVPGVSTVYISGDVTERTAATGHFKVLGSTAILVDSAAPRLNDRIEVVGTQPQVGGVIIATTVKSKSFDTDSIIGTGISKSSIIGTGVLADSIIGTGVTTNSIIGTGVQANSIIGTGITTNSIIGTGIQANSIIGTGITTNSIIGTGVATNSIIGTGIKADSIIGTGVTTNSIIGTGISKSSIIGTGVQTDSIIGTGITAY